MFLYVYTKANQMVDHDFTDDVALVFAWTTKQALKKFCRLYDAQPENIYRIKLINMLFRKVPSVLTDY